jgi:hypothetical protein
MGASENCDHDVVLFGVAQGEGRSLGLGQEACVAYRWAAREADLPMKTILVVRKRQVQLVEGDPTTLRGTVFGDAAAENDT